MDTDTKMEMPAANGFSAEAPSTYYRTRQSEVAPPWEPPKVSKKTEEELIASAKRFDERYEREQAELRRLEDQRALDEAERKQTSEAFHAAKRNGQFQPPSNGDPAISNGDSANSLGKDR